MPKKPYKAYPKQLSEEDKNFIKLVQSGKKKSESYRLAYPEDQRVIKYMDMKGSSSPEVKAERDRLAELIRMAAKHKLQAEYIQKGIVTFTNRMDMLAEQALDVAEELMLGAESENVRKDLAIEFIRQHEGTPVQKIAIKEDKVVVIRFGKPREVIDVVPED